MPDLLGMSGVAMPAHTHSSLESFDAGESGPTPLAAAREFLEAAKRAGKWDQVQGLYLVGETGTGKTHLAVGVLRELILEWSDESPLAQAVYDYAPRLVREVQDHYGRGGCDELIRRRIQARVWILDDFGAEKATDDVVSVMNLVLNERERRATMLTSNLTPDEIAERHDEYFRLRSRIGSFRVVMVRGRDRRFDR
jgi:DNA replication protein DnaC